MLWSDADDWVGGEAGGGQKNADPPNRCSDPFIPHRPSWSRSRSSAGTAWTLSWTDAGTISTAAVEPPELDWSSLEETFHFIK